MDDRLFVSYHQYEVTAEPGEPGLEIYHVGDDLLHAGGPSHLTGFCGLHTGWIEARVRLLAGPPAAADAGWDDISEATLWCPDGELSVIGLMGGTAPALTDVPVPRGLIRVRLHARNRLDETERTDDDPPEQHEIHVWAVSRETPWRTVLSGRRARGWEQKPAEAAEWAMLSLLSPDPDDDDTGLSRVAVVRQRAAPVEVRAGVLPAGDLEVRLEVTGGGTLTWSWATAAEPIFPRPLTRLPDASPSTVRVSSGPDGFTLRHEGVLGRHAAALGLIWDYLLDTAGSDPWMSHPWTSLPWTSLPWPSLPSTSLPWMEKLRAQARSANLEAEKSRRLQAEREALLWGGSSPSGRVRGLQSQASSLARIDRSLLDRIEALPAAGQREAARWAARRAMRVAGLERIEWIAEALDAADAGRPLPPSLTEQGGGAGFTRLLSDPEMPHTTVALPRDLHGFGGRDRPEMLQQAVAFPALLALGKADPLVAAIDAVYNAAIAHGEERDSFLADAHTALARPS